MSDIRRGLKVGDLVRIGDGFFGACANTGMVGEITGFSDAEDGSLSSAIIEVRQTERVDTRRLSRLYRCASPRCPGYSYKASQMPHPAGTCGEGGPSDAPGAE